MRRGLVFLLILAADGATGQDFGGFGAPWTHAGGVQGGMMDPWHFKGNGLIRADGTPLGAPSPSAIRPTDMAVSFRHYAHKPVKTARHHFEQGMRAFAHHKDAESLKRLEEAVRLDPEFFEAHLQMGLMLLNADDAAVALTHLEKAVAIDPSSQLGQALSAWALLKLGRFDEAELALRRTRQLGRSIEIIDELLTFVHQRRLQARQSLAAR